MGAIAALRPAAFLDRDGTLIEDPGYLAAPAQVRLIRGAASALIGFERAGFLRIVITNQSGIGRGRYPVSALMAVHHEVERQLRDAGASVDAMYHCPHAPDAGCPCRKPGTALFREAIATWAIDPSLSWCIGDQPRDLEPAGIIGARALLVRTGHGSQYAEDMLANGTLVADDLAAGFHLISRYL